MPCEVSYKKDMTSFHNTACSVPRIEDLIKEAILQDLYSLSSEIDYPLALRRRERAICQQ